MHTHDMKSHDIPGTDEGEIRGGETPSEARSHAPWAIALIAVMVVGPCISLTQS